MSTNSTSRSAKCSTFSTTWSRRTSDATETGRADLATIGDDGSRRRGATTTCADADVVPFLTLRLMTHEQTVASLSYDLAPEDFGGGQAQLGLPLRRRRDAALTDRVAHRRAAPTRSASGGTGRPAVVGDPIDLQMMYAVDGFGTCPSTPSITCPATRGPDWSGSATAPSYRSKTDVLGEVMVALSAARAAGLDSDEDSGNSGAQPRQPAGGDLEGADHGPGRSRSQRVFSTHSRVMVWRPSTGRSAPSRSRAWRAPTAAGGP